VIKGEGSSLGEKYLGKVPRTSKTTTEKIKKEREERERRRASLENTTSEPQKKKPTPYTRRESL